ncbi:hypothetical protein [Aureimonas sp. AU12]|uniref:hypothetical protein n=1 Tax=Aureimonas sp. AU12 TaxID=1638161 RepID=UPI0007806FAA|nr:hypothetical protein [Aureimonas sp. AU12]
MTDFFDWLSAADSGAAAERIASQFRLTHEEMRRTTDALVPAFMLGMQRAMANPAAWTTLVSDFTKSATVGGAAFPTPGAGRTVMNGLFGADLLQAIARQASLLTGQAPDVIEKMMPALGALTFQSMLQMMAAGPGSYPTDGAGQGMAEALRRSANAVEAFNRPSGAGGGGRAGAAAPMSSLFAEALRGGLPWMPAPSMRGGAMPGGDPFAFFTSMMSAFAPPAAPPPEPPRAAPAETKPTDPFTGMIGTAQTMQADYISEMLSLFDRHRQPKP